MPDAVAVVYEAERLTYGQLNARANQVAHHLIGLGIRPDDRVALCVQRSLDMVVGVLGILKAGGAYVPLDPSYPAQRLAYMLQDSAPVALLTQQALLDDLPALGLMHTVVLDDEVHWRAIGRLSRSDPDARALGLTSRNLAYVIYTSGSTGRPKGVMVEHRSVVRLVCNTNYVDLGVNDVVGQASTISFDAATFEIWGALLNGARLAIVPQAVVLQADRFAQALKTHEINVLWLTASLFHTYVDTLEEAFGQLRYLLVGGEVLDPIAIDRTLRRSCRPQWLINGYGPTETTTFAATFQIERLNDAFRPIPIGRPIANTRIYILDGQGQPVPIGVTGEIYIGGAGVARGYLNQPQLTAERFVADPYAGPADARMYRTGDLGRWLEDGNIEYLGRNDDQVKIRGYRIELGEVQAQLAGCPGVKEAVVVVRQDGGGDKRLVAYVTAQEQAQLTAAQLRGRLLEVLAEYMVPSAYVVLDKLPLTPNGKLDRQGLPAPDRAAVVAQRYEEPQGEVERAIAQVWQQLLGLERVGRHDHFFELGGHSLLVISLIERLRDRGLIADVRSVFAAPTPPWFDAAPFGRRQMGTRAKRACPVFSIEVRSNSIDCY